MKKRPAGNSRLFFIEFMIVLFFFLIISTVCLKLFAQAHQITERADDLSRAQTMAASAAELLLAGYDQEEAEAFFAQQSAENDYSLDIVPDTVTAASDTDQQSGNHAYVISVRKDKDKNTVLYELSVTTHAAPWEQEVAS